MDKMLQALTRAHLTRRQLLQLAAGAAGAGVLASGGLARADWEGIMGPRASAAGLDDAALLAAVTPAAVGATAAAPQRGFQQLAQAGFAPINAALTFGAPTDLAAGWDGTLWAIDGHGAPHRYDPLGDSWQLHGTGIGGAALINDAGPAVYFRGPEVFIADSKHGAQAIGDVWPQLPPSYKLGVKGAAWAGGKVVLFRGGTYLTAPWAPTGALPASPAPSTAGPEPVRAFAAMASVVATPVPTRAGHPGATPTVPPAATATATPAGTPPTTTPPATPTAGAPTPSPAVRAAQVATADYVALPLAGIAGWPQTANWQAGVIDGVYSQGGGVVLAIRGGEFVTLTFAAGAAPTASGPNPLSSHASFGALPADWQATGFDTGFFVLLFGVSPTIYATKGAQAMVYGAPAGAAELVTPPPAAPGGAQAATPAPAGGAARPTSPAQRPVAVEASVAGIHYIAELAALWPPSWHPTCQHAPSGRAGGLWAATVEGHVVSFDGTAWTRQPGDAISVAAGVDGSVFAVPKSNPAQLAQWNGQGWATVAQHAAPLAQVSVGNQGLVWTRDGGNAVHQLSQGQLQPVPLAGAAADIGANHDGTLWHCTGGDANALRLAPDLGAPPAAVPVAGTVQKIASTRFGAAHCLATANGATQAFSYQSPYAFRTAGSYVPATDIPLEQGLGSLFLTVIAGTPEDGPYQVVALDTHTGQELSRSATSPPGLQYTPPVYDPVHETIIVGLTAAPYQSNQTGQLLGLDARDLSQVRWSLTLPNNMPLGPGQPTLQGTQLCVSDNFNTLVMYDTGAPGVPTPAYRWTYNFPSAPQDDHRLPPPVIANGTVYAAWWLYSTSYGYLQLWLWKLDAATGAAVDTKSVEPYLPPNPTADLDSWNWMGLASPLLVTLPGAQPGQSRQVLYVNGGTSVWGIDVAAATGQAYDLPGNNATVTSGLGYAGGVLWFGDNGGTLYGLDSTLKPVPNTPASLGGGQTYGITTTPVPYTDSQGNTAVLLSQTTNPQPGLQLFDPSSGGVITIPTQGTFFTTLTTAVGGGVIYGAGGASGIAGGADPVQQVFGLRVDEAVQELRDFVVESQLQQDFDDPSQPTHNPNGVARYRTHLTLLNNAKAPLANEAVKLWADKVGTTILVNDQPFTIGPDDDQYAAVQTGTDGTLVIVSGATAVGGAKADTSASPLRAWAAFMDPHERILILPDREFHNRVATAHATAPGQAGADDPTRVNLQTAQQYGPVQQGGANGGGAIFTAQQQQDKQPQQTATAIQQMTGAVGTAPAAGGTTPAAAGTARAASWTRSLTAGPGKYIAYPDAPGGQYSPVNVAADRAAVVLQPAGISYTGGTQAVYAPVAPAAATQAIDALPGQDWLTSPYAPPPQKAAARAGEVRAFSIWDDFWGWLKGAAATITHVIVAVAEDIYAGIRVLVNDVEYVFRAIITGIEEAVSAIGAFFIQLGIEIEQMLEALSVIFQFGHIVDTHNILKAQLLNTVNGVAGNAAYPGFAALMKNTVQPKLDSFFTTAEQEVADALNGLADKLVGAPPSALAGGGSTAHTAFTATPKGGGAPSSTGTQSTWGLQKYNGGGGAAVSAAVRASQVSATDPTAAVVAVFTDFAQSLASNQVLAGQWDKVKQGTQSLGNAGSAENFLEQALAELLRILALLVDGVLAVGKAMVDGLIGAIDALIAAIFGDGGLVTAPLDIPVLSWLYQLLFGEPLTILNAMMMIMAIPVTIMWKVVEGKWPAESWSGVTATPGALAAQTLDTDGQRLMGYCSGIWTIVGGFIFAAGDITGAESVAVDKAVAIGRMGLITSIAASGFSVPLYFSDTVSALDWSSWGIGVATGLLNLLSAVDLSGAPESLELGKLGPVLLSALSAASVFVDGLIFHAEPPPNPLGDAALGLSIASALPGILNPLKLQSEPGAIVVAVLDVVMGFAAGVAAILSAYSVTAQLPGAPVPGTLALAADGGPYGLRLAR